MMEAKRETLQKRHSRAKQTEQQKEEARKKAKEGMQRKRARESAEEKHEERKKSWIRKRQYVLDLCFVFCDFVASSAFLDCGCISEIALVLALFSCSSQISRALGSLRRSTRFRSSQVQQVRSRLA